jgi:hypothetical protein
MSEKNEVFEQEKINYDYQSSISFIGIITTICSLFGGFAFTGIIAFLTSGDPTPILSQVTLFILYLTMSFFTNAVFSLNNLNNLVSMQSEKTIIPIYPKIWRNILNYMAIGMTGLEIAVPLMFLSKNLVILFIVSITIMMIMLYKMVVRDWNPIEKELRKRGILQ